MSSNMWDEITYPFPNFDGVADKWFHFTLCNGCNYLTLNQVAVSWETFSKICSRKKIMFLIDFLCDLSLAWGPGDDTSALIQVMMTRRRKLNIETCRRGWHQRLSLWQPRVAPVKTKLVGIVTASFIKVSINTQWVTHLGRVSHIYALWKTALIHFPSNVYIYIYIYIYIYLYASQIPLFLLYPQGQGGQGHIKLSKWQLPVEPMKEVLSKWHFRCSVWFCFYRIIRAGVAKLEVFPPFKAAGARRKPIINPIQSTCCDFNRIGSH